jgi:membrane-associated phospholipid phosphatase
MRLGLKEFLRRLAFFSLFLLGTFGYLFTNRFNMGRGLVPVIVDTPIDAWIPLVPVFVVPYLLFFLYVIGSVVVLFFDPSDRYYRLVWTVFVGMVVATAVFYYYPTYMDRPTLIGGGAFLDVLRFVYANDAPYNCLPSTHVFYSIVAFYHLYRWKPNAKRSQTLSFLFCLLVCVSTVLVKQHHTPDILAGFALAVGVALLVEIPKEVVPWRKST